MQSSVATVDTYLEDVAPDRRAALERLRVDFVVIESMLRATASATRVASQATASHAAGFRMRAMTAGATRDRPAASRLGAAPLRMHAGTIGARNRAH